MNWRSKPTPSTSTHIFDFSSITAISLVLRCLANTNSAVHGTPFPAREVKVLLAHHRRLNTMSSLGMPFEIRLQWLAFLQVSLLVYSTAAQMPYNPTRILQNNDTLYVFQPSSKSPTQFQLSSLDISSQVIASNVAYATLYPTLPFLDDNVPRAFTPILGDGGNITVYTGDCALGASGGEVWNFTPGLSGDKSKSSWKKEEVSVTASSHASIMGANFLNGGMSFSSIVRGKAADTGTYLFGGMCPNQNDTTSDWQSAANYSNLMVTLQPSASGQEPLSYDLDISTSRGQPVPEAGFTVTGLSPTFSDRNDGIQIQQQNFVLVGGHISNAFINMSQIALFSLPEQGWTFIGVQEPDTSQNDLAIRADVATIDPRSGHTAVLSPDGQQIIIFGGWVGDITNPAQPQFAVLNVADGYGGKGDWQWTIPSTSGIGLSDNTGLYGHGAAMLPGGVLMITGGYSIPAPSTRQRRVVPTANTQAYFLNVSSNTWMTEYSPPTKETQSEPSRSGLLSTLGQKAGLGVGIGIGLAAFCGLFAFYMWYSKRLKRQRDLREKQLQDLSYAAHRYNVEDCSPGVDDRAGRSDTLDYLVDPNGPYYFPSGTQGGQGWKAADREDVERSGLLVEIPSPTRGLRRSLSGRPGYAAGRTRGPGSIHPIDELEEEPDDEQAHDRTPLAKPPEMAERRPDQDASILDTAPILDPFTDHHGRDSRRKSALHSVVTSHTRQHSGQAESNELVRLSPSLSGRLSPDKSTSDERTSSNLSEQSTLSWTSSNGGVLRSTSIRAAAILSTASHANPFKLPDASPTHDKARSHSESGRYSSSDPQTQSLTSSRSNGHADNDTFRTAQSSFAHLQAEGEALLGGNPERPRPGTGSSNSNANHDTDGSHSRAATATPATSIAMDLASASRSPIKERRMSWLGSVRRVLARSASSAERTRSLTTALTYYEPYRDDPISPVEPSTADNRKSSPAAIPPPRRAASDASFWRNRRGKQDWLEDEQDPTWRRTAGDDWGAPEDIVLAERERARQEWRERGNLLVKINNDDQLPTPLTPIGPGELGIPAEMEGERPCTPASEADWDVEAAVERRVVQVMFTVPKSKLRVVNADVDGCSIMSVPREGDDGEPSSSAGHVKDLAGRFEQMSGSPRSPRASPRPSPSNSIKSMKIRQKASSASLARQQSMRSVRKGRGVSPLGKGKERAAE
jgi:hypothetical protein